MITMTNVPAMQNYAETLSKDYAVRVNGEPAAVYVMRESRVPLACMEYAPREREYTELASFVSFAADAFPVVLKVRTLTRKGEICIRPLSDNVAFRTDGETTTLTIERAGQYSFECGDAHCALNIFADERVDFGDKSKFSYYFGPGIHCPGVIYLKDGDSVYIDRDAVVYGSLFARGAKNIKICGHGVLDGSYEQRVFAHCYEDCTKSILKFHECENLTVDGIILRDAAIWVISLFGCKNVCINNIKEIGHWRPNTDGIDVVNSSQVRIKNSYLRTFDDTITLKGIDLYQHLCVENVFVDNCVLWCGWGRTLEIGLETACKTYKNISFTDCDLIHNSAAALDIQNGDYAEVSDVRYENIRVEYQAYAQSEYMQTAPAEKYKGYSGWVPKLIVINNFRFRECYTDFPPNDTKYENSFVVRDVLFKNIFVTFPDGLPLPEMRIGSLIDGVRFKNITIDGLFLNGKRLRQDECNLLLDKTDNFLIK